MARADDLRVEHERLLALLDAARTSLEHERRRWARELHDTTLQGLAAALLSLSATQCSDDEARVRATLVEVIANLGDEIVTLRALIADIAPAALLDGGIGAYEGPLETAAPQPQPKRFTSTPWPRDRVASIGEAADANASVVLDARQRERYLGEPNPLDPRAGHIPGARSLPARENVDDAGRFLPVDELRRRLAAVGIDRPDTPVISSCGSGVTACHNLLVLEHAGVGRGRLYAGSWSQWAADPERPVATGDDVVFA